MFPEPPSFTERQLHECAIANDFRPMLFEWYKYVGLICNVIASISENSEAYKRISEIRHAVLIGLLNRCSRLVLANIALTHKGLHGETFEIIQRCIFESSTKLIWLCSKNSTESLNQYLADGMKSDIELMEYINREISNRNGEVQTIEKRMIISIMDVINKTGLSIEEIKTYKLPTLSDMMNDIEANKDRLLYIVNQKLASHSTHGTWTNLVKHYLLYEEGIYHLRDHNVEVQDIQYVASSYHVINALISFVEYIFEDGEVRQHIISLLNDISKEIYNLSFGRYHDDFLII